MRSELQQKQMHLTTIRTERNRVQRRLTGAEEQLKEAQIVRDRLHEQLTKEQQDVVKLGKFSFMNKISEWRGTWDERMGKEIAEAAEAELLYNEAEKNVTDLEAEVKRYREEINSSEFLYIDEEWEDFLKEKETWIRRNDSNTYGTLLKISDERVSLRSLLREIDEAQDAGNKASRSLEKALDKLDSAEGMSIWDTFLGGGMIVSALKYSEIDSSDDYVHRAQRALRHFETELMDVENVVTTSFTVNNNDIYTFTDIFFDNIFSDWTVHSRITEAKSKLNSVLQEVQRVMDQLRRKLDETENGIEKLDAEERAIIEA
ncbi:hypothetical protein ACFSFY_12090 [Sporosarcina siberiensis]|uniref:Uncharacterized protein n=1 Tax=Sporosarcina siberiensis TaxID=1365606 RepID=A0ABW4SGX8_9BACL